jgi:hypothetical protein
MSFESWLQYTAHKEALETMRDHYNKLNFDEVGMTFILDKGKINYFSCIGMGDVRIGDVLIRGSNCFDVTLIGLVDKRKRKQTFIRNMDNTTFLLSFENIEDKPFENELYPEKVKAIIDFYSQFYDDFQSLRNLFRERNSKGKRVNNGVPLGFNFVKFTYVQQVPQHELGINLIDDEGIRYTITFSILSEGRTEIRHIFSLPQKEWNEGGIMKLLYVAPGKTPETKDNKENKPIVDSIINKISDFYYGYEINHLRGVLWVHRETPNFNLYIPKGFKRIKEFDVFGDDYIKIGLALEDCNKFVFIPKIKGIDMYGAINNPAYVEKIEMVRVSDEEDIKIKIKGFYVGHSFDMIALLLNKGSEYMAVPYDFYWFSSEHNTTKNTIRLELGGLESARYVVILVKNSEGRIAINDEIIKVEEIKLPSIDSSINPLNSSINPLKGPYPYYDNPGKYIRVYHTTADKIQGFSDHLSEENELKFLVEHFFKNCNEDIWHPEGFIYSGGLPAYLPSESKCGYLNVCYVFESLITRNKYNVTLSKGIYTRKWHLVDVERVRELNPVEKESREKLTIKELYDIFEYYLNRHEQSNNPPPGFNLKDICYYHGDRMKTYSLFSMAEGEKFTGAQYKVQFNRKERNALWVLHSVEVVSGVIKDKIIKRRSNKND